MGMDTADTYDAASDDEFDQALNYEPGSGALPQSIHWDAPEYTHHERGRDWYWGLGIGVVAFSGIGIYLHDALFAALIIIGAIAVVIYAMRTPNMMSVELGIRGIKMNNQLYPYVTLDSYWVTPREHNRKIIIRSRKKLMPWIVIPVPDDADEHMVREFLLKHVREEQHDEPLVDVLMDRLRF